jgi:curved DNA-binding protein CbpA
MTTSEDYYEILGVPRNATSKQIRERFLQLARDRHPDRFDDTEKVQAEEEFQLITQAYNVLHDDYRRLQYDKETEERSKSPTEDVRSQAARVYLRRGVEAFNKKRYKEAATNLEQATHEDASDPESWYYLAQVYGQRTSWLSKGLAAASKACELEPSNPDFLKQAGKMAALAGMAGRALKYYRDALTYGGEDPEVRAAIKGLRKGRG